MATSYIELCFCQHCLLTFVYKSVTVTSMYIPTHPPIQPALMHPAAHQPSIMLHVIIIRWPFGLQKVLNSNRVFVENKN